MKMINVILSKNGYPPWITDVKVENTKFHEFKLLIKRCLNGRLRRNLCKERIN